MGELYYKLFMYSDAHNIKPAGPAFAVYYSYDPEGNVVFEAGVPVEGEVKTDDEVIFKKYDKMKVVSTLYVGAYEDMASIYGTLEQYLKENKLETTGTSWEVYLTDPNEVASPKENQTMIYFPIK